MRCGGGGQSGMGGWAGGDGGRGGGGGGGGLGRWGWRRGGAGAAGARRQGRGMGQRGGRNSTGHAARERLAQPFLALSSSHLGTTLIGRIRWRNRHRIFDRGALIGRPFPMVLFR